MRESSLPRASMASGQASFGMPLSTGPDLSVQHINNDRTRFSVTNGNMEITLNHYLILAAILFSIGVVGVVARRNLLIIFMSIELMLSSVNLVFLAFSKFLNQMEGHVWVFLILAVAASEAAVGLGIIVALFRGRKTVYADEVRDLKG